MELQGSVPNSICPFRATLTMSVLMPVGPRPAEMGICWPCASRASFAEAPSWEWREAWRALLSRPHACRTSDGLGRDVDRGSVGRRAIVVSFPCPRPGQEGLVRERSAGGMCWRWLAQARIIRARFGAYPGSSRCAFEVLYGAYCIRVRRFLEWLSDGLGCEARRNFTGPAITLPLRPPARLTDERPSPVGGDSWSGGELQLLLRPRPVASEPPCG